jgi:16S rRNA (guanine1207-N2)-methyltransferase
VSGPARSGAHSGNGGDDLTADPGVLANEPVFEVGGTRAVARVGGMALIYWRAEYLRANGITVVEQAPQPPQFSQALVRLNKGRLANDVDVAQALQSLIPGGQLFLHGLNEVGVVSCGKRLGAILQQTPQVVANRARGRVIRFIRGSISVSMPTATLVPLDSEGHVNLLVEPGVFSGDGLDQGTQAMQSYLAQLPAAKNIVDMGCGAGHLAFTALRLWPQATASLLDADRRAVRSAILNASMLGLAERVQCQWWDTSESVAQESADLVLINPPCHAGVATDYAIARRMFQHAAAMMTPDGQVLVVANRQLPYEGDLAALGQMRVVHQHGGFKIIALTKT